MEINQNLDRESQIDDIQARQYSFPYHYIPSISTFPFFNKGWSFADSYLAAIRLFDNWFADQVKEQRNHRHMDFGCGDGGFLHHIAMLGKYGEIEFFGIDSDERAISWARQFSGSNNFLCEDIKDLPHSSYDSGSLVEVYEHIPPSECSEFLSNIADALKPGAPLFVTVPSTQKPLEAKHYRHFDLGTLAKEFEAFFSIEEIYGFEHRSFISRFFKRILKTRWWSIETKFTSEYLISHYAAKHSNISGCGRIGMTVRKC